MNQWLWVFCPHTLRMEESWRETGEDRRSPSRGQWGGGLRGAAGFEGHCTRPGRVRSGPCACVWAGGASLPIWGSRAAQVLLIWSCLILFSPSEELETISKTLKRKKVLPFLWVILGTYIMWKTNFQDQPQPLVDSLIKKYYIRMERVVSSIRVKKVPKEIILFFPLRRCFMKRLL